MKKITLCADDFGQNSAICEGILKLIELKRLSAVSCLSTFPDFETYGSKLKIFANQIELGLHINFTEKSNHKDLLVLPLPKLITQSFLKKLDITKIKESILLQLESFQRIIGKQPDFIDGHQHVHHLPIVRDVLLEIYQDKFKEKKPWIRISANSFSQTLRNFNSLPKKLIIALTGAWKLQKKLNSLKIPHNASFSGIYNFQNTQNYRQYFLRFLQGIDNNGLIMCHPGFAGANTQDPLYNSRKDEWDYFASDIFVNDINENQIIL